MAILKKTLFDEHLENINVLVKDTAPLSRYFRITELPTAFTGGKNAFLIQGSSELVLDTIVKIQIRDAKGDIIYHEPGEGIPEYYEGTSKVVAVYIYPDTAFGPCTITILGELKEYTDSNGFVVPVPDVWKDTYNVKWETQVNVNPALVNTTKIRFYRRPKIDISESILPIYNRAVTTSTITGTLDGVSIYPIEGDDYRSFKGVLQYQLQMNGDSQFSQSMEGETITITGLSSSYTPIITDVVNNKTAYVNIPYYETSPIFPSYQAVKSFSSASFSLTYDENVVVSDSSVSSSFATIKISDLETFAGDANRIKVYASSRNDLGDFVLLEDIQLESNELLQVASFDNQLNVRTGLFTDSILSTYWTSSTIETDSTLSVDNSLLIKSAVLTPTTDYSSSVGLFKFLTKNDIAFTQNTEYQLDFTPLLESAVDKFGGLEVYLSGSAFVNTTRTDTYGKKIGEVKTNTNYRKFDKQQINFKPDSDGNGKLVFIVKGGKWHIADISLRAAQESSFSPNEMELIVNVPVKIVNETFDFKFEIFDINSNYVPVKIEATHTFTGGNDLVVKKGLEIRTSGTSFNFSSGSAYPQNIIVQHTVSGLTGSVTYYSQSIDINGNPITGSPQPGELTYTDISTRTLTLGSFTGSLAGVTVGAVLYTASCEDLNRYFTIFRIDQGAASKLFYATADKNTFIFDSNDRYKSVVPNDYIDIRLVQQNLPAETSTLTISSGSQYGTPPKLNYQGSIGNAEVYRLWVTSSAHQSGSDGYLYELGKSHYDFSLSTTEGAFSSSIAIDVNTNGQSGKGLVASSDRNQFFYKMTDISAYPSAQTATINVKRQNLGSLTSVISVTSGSDKPALTVGATSNGVTTYTIGTATYPYTAGETTYTFTSYDLNGSGYTDFVTISPIIVESQISVFLTNENATLPARYDGWIASSSFVSTSGSVSVTVGGEDITMLDGLGSNNRWDLVSATGINCTPNNATPTDATYGITALNATSGSLSLIIGYRDGRGTATYVTRSVSYTKALQGNVGIPATSIVVSPTSQTVIRDATGSYATPVSISVAVTEHSASYTYDDSSPYGNTTFRLASVLNGTNNNNGTITPNTPTTMAGTSVSFNVVYVNSAGAEVTIPQTHKVSVSLSGQTGPGVVFTGPWVSGRAYQFSSGDGTGRRDVVLFGGTYYATLLQHTSDDTNKPPNATYWESLGTEDFFVAAKIALFEESYVQNTLNVGTNNSGGVSTANITLAGGTSNPYISLGQTVMGTYGEKGIYIGNNNSTASLSIVGDNGWLKWNGSTLDIKGSITITGGNAATTSSVDNAVTSASYALYNANTASIFTDTTGKIVKTPTTTGDGLYLGNTHLGYYSGSAWKTYMANNGNFYLTGMFGDYLKWEDGVLTIKGAIDVTGGNASTTSSVENAALSASYAAASASYALANANTASIFTNTAGQIVKTPSTGSQGLYLGSNYMGYYDGSIWKTYMANNGNFYLNGSVGGDYLSWAGSTLTIKGAIDITGGQAATDISNAQSTANAAAASANTAQSTANTAQSTANTALADAKASGSTEPGTQLITKAAVPSGNGLYLGSNNMGYYNGSWKTYMASNGDFFLNGTNGYLQWNSGADTLSIKGTVTATAGAVGGWTIDSNSIYSGTKDISGFSTTGITLYSGGSIHTPYFYADQSGAAINGTITATGGTIGGFTIGASALYTGTKSTYASTDSGVYIGNDGIALGANSVFKVNSNGNLTASSAAISGVLTAGTVTIGKDAGGTGIHGVYIDANNYWYSTGVFKVGDGTNNMVYSGGALSLNGSISSAATITGGIFRTSASGQRAELEGGSSNELRFYDTSGNLVVRLGQSSPYTGLFVDNGIIASVNSFWANSNTAGTVNFSVDDGTVRIADNSTNYIYMTPFVIQVTNGTIQTYIDSSKVESSAFYQTSDINFKQNISSVEVSKLNNVNRIEFKQFSFKTDTTNRIRYGVIAQDVETEFPELVIESVSKDKDDNEHKHLTVDYNSLFALKINSLENTIVNLMKRIEELESKLNDK